ncbi:actin interacting protein 3-domain-containing protein [Infundibulicybe gibba]|nr:actin interacting protein 3-domain-containing protein [Infundibulicybe gibba]
MSSSRSNPTSNTAQSAHAYGHRRDNPSISSTHSSRSDQGARQPAHPAVESAVTLLLVAIKQLLEALTLWSQLKMDENQVSDVYVRLGNEFNAAVTAFAAFNINMSELLSVPDDLRTVLEQCLAEDANPENLEIYLPTVRQIITNLLHGLRGKQTIYRKIVSDQKHKSDQSSRDRDSRSSRGERQSRREGHRSHLSQASTEDRGDRDSRRAARSGRKESGSHYAANGDGQFIGGFSPVMVETPVDRGVESEALPNPYESQRAKTPDAPLAQSPARQSQPLEAENPLPSQANDVTRIPPSLQPTVPASVKRYPLVDTPAPPPPVVIEPSSPEHRSSTSPPETPPLEPPPYIATSLAALKQSDALERKASKRFSSYNISKMTGVPATTTRERSTRKQANRRSLAASSTLTPGELAVLTEVDDEEIPARSADRQSKSRPTSQVFVAEPDQQPDFVEASPVPSVPPDPLAKVPPQEHAPAPFSDHATTTQPPEALEPPKISVFLQLGREVKKVTVEADLSFRSLRVLFVEKFSYNPGLENFPAIYIRDPSCGVQYELEDTDEVKENSLLSLNIEPLDQIKQHIDTQISNLSQDIKELKSAVTNRQSGQFAQVVSQPLAESTPAPNRPSDRQFQNVARRLSRFVGEHSPPSHANPFTSTHTPIPMQITGQSLQPQMTGSSVLSDYTGRVVSDLKTQFDEVQNLRRDLGIMRQLYTEFMKQTKASLTMLRGQTQTVKQLASADVGGARAYIDTGKKKLDIRSQNVLTEVEKLQDTVEGVKDDVIKRHITPKAQYFKNVKKDIDTVATELKSLQDHINTIKPMWKKTWEEELHNIVEEQQFLNHQEEFLNDLIEDHKAVFEVYGHVEKVISLRGSGPSRVAKNRFRPPPPEEGHNGLSTVMLEIRGAAVDPEKRMKAIEASRKNREKELASRSDDLQAELFEFVGGKKLKMTGGAEEAERVRQRRNELTMKAMFNGGGVSVGPESPTSPPF